MSEKCNECGALTREGRDAMQERYRKRPIYGTNFDRPLSETIEALRGQITQIRGKLTDIRFAYPGWGERTESVEGLLTCGLIALYEVAAEMKKFEKGSQETA